MSRPLVQDPDTYVPPGATRSTAPDLRGLAQRHMHDPSPLTPPPSTGSRKLDVLHRDMRALLDAALDDRDWWQQYAEQLQAALHQLGPEASPAQAAVIAKALTLPPLPPSGREF